MATRVFAAVLLGAVVSAGGCKRSAAVTVETVEPAPVAQTEPPPRAEQIASSRPASVYDDLGSKVVARTLEPPQTPKVPMGRRTKPLPWRGLVALERPELPLAEPLTNVISLPPAKTKAPRPRLLADIAPLIEYTAEPAPPQRLDMPPAQLIRTPSRDVNLPIDLPAQANWKPDRAGLDDPAAEFALESAQSAASPLREQPAPFVPVNLPEPFPNRASVTAPAPEPPVVAATPQPPK